MIEYINRLLFFSFSFYRTENGVRIVPAHIVTMEHGTLDLILQTASHIAVVVGVAFFHCSRSVQKQSSNILDDVDVNTCRAVDAM